MLSFKQLLLLQEDRIQLLKDQHKEIDTSHDTLAKHKDAGAIIDHFASHDPHPKKAYTQWVVGQYRKGHIRQEDAGRVHDALKNFDRYKGKLEKKDVNQYKHISHLEDAVEPHLNTVASNKEQKKLIKHEGADLIHSENGVTVHRIKTKEAACHYGAGTKWCTAASKNNMFNHYNEEGPLYVVQTPERDVHGLSTRGPVKLPASKYQFHFESEQFMDAKDNPIDTHQLTRSYPELKNVKEWHEHENQTLAHGPFLHDEDRDHLYNHIAKHGQDYDQRKLATISPKHAAWMLKTKPGHFLGPFAHEYVASTVMNDHDHLLNDPEVLHHLINHQATHIRRDLALKSKSYAEKMVNDPHHVVRQTIADNYPDLAHHFINDKDEDVRAKVAGMKKFSHHFVNDESDYVRVHAATNPDVAAHMIHDKAVGVRVSTASHEHLAHHFINDPSPWVREEAARHRSVASHMIHDTHDGVRTVIAQKHPDLAHHLINDEHNTVRDEARVSVTRHHGIDALHQHMVNSGISHEDATKQAKEYQSIHDYYHKK